MRVVFRRANRPRSVQKAFTRAPEYASLSLLWVKIMDRGRLPVKISLMTAIRVVYDGNAFIPQQSVSLPDKFEALVLVEQNDPQAGAQLDADIRAYYENAADSEDDAWAAATSPQSRRACRNARMISSPRQL